MLGGLSRGNDRFLVLGRLALGQAIAETREEPANLAGQLVAALGKAGALFGLGPVVVGTGGVTQAGKRAKLIGGHALQVGIVALVNALGTDDAAHQPRLGVHDLAGVG